MKSEGDGRGVLGEEDGRGSVRGERGDERACGGVKRGVRVREESSVYRPESKASVCVGNVDTTLNKQTNFF